MKIEVIISIILIVSYIGLVISKACQPRNFRVLINTVGLYQLQTHSIHGPWWLSNLYTCRGGDIWSDWSATPIIGDKEYINNILISMKNI